jgi:hypothetical protein
MAVFYKVEFIAVEIQPVGSNSVKIKLPMPALMKFLELARVP